MAETAGEGACWMYTPPFPTDLLSPVLEQDEPAPAIILLCACVLYVCIFFFLVQRLFKYLSGGKAAHAV